MQGPVSCLRWSFSASSDRSELSKLLPGEVESPRVEIHYKWGLATKVGDEDYFSHTGFILFVPVLKRVI